MTAIAQAVTSALLHFVWQGMAVAILLWLALFLLRHGAARARYAASSAALALLALLPIVTACLVYSRPAQWQSSAMAPPSLPRIAAAVAKASPALPANFMAMVQAWALPVWSLGVLLFSIRLVWGCRAVSLLRRRGAPADGALTALVAALARRLGVRQQVAVLIATHAESPSVVGWLRPVILVPSATLLGLTTEQLEAVLAHELAHIRRHDYLVNVAQILAETLLFYHPAVWWASARMRHERELCCDDLAVRCCGDAVCYARALTLLERLRIAGPEMALGSNDGSMLYRIRRLVSGGAPEYGPSKLPGIVALILGLAFLGMNLHRAHGQEIPGGVQRGWAVSVPNDLDSPGIQVDVAGAAMVRRTSVEYPAAAWDRRIEGTVLLEASLDDAGMVTDARVLAGPAELRKAALRSVLEWQFVPQSGGSSRHINIAFRRVEGERKRLAIAAPSIQYELRSAAQRERQEQILNSSRENLARAQSNLENAPAGQQAAVEQMAAAMKRLEAQQANLDGHRQAELTRKFLEQELAKSQIVYEGRRRQAEQAQGTAEAAHAQRELETLEAQYKELVRRLDAAIQVQSIGSLAGRRLERIRIDGLDEESRKSLAAKLPVHVGETLTAESIAALKALVNQFDPKMECNLGISEDGTAELHITAPSGRK